MSLDDLEAAMDATRSSDIAVVNQANATLNAWQETPQAAPMALEVMKRNRNVLNVMLACTVLARKIERDWQLFAPEFRAEVPVFLTQAIMASGGNEQLCRVLAIALSATASSDSPALLAVHLDQPPPNDEVLGIRLTLFVTFGEQGCHKNSTAKRRLLQNFFENYADKLQVLVEMGIRSGNPVLERLAFALENCVAKWADFVSKDTRPIVQLALENVRAHPECVDILRTLFVEKLEGGALFKKTDKMFFAFFAENEDLIQEHLQFMTSVLTVCTHIVFREIFQAGELDVNVVRRVYASVLRAELDEDSVEPYFQFWRIQFRDLFQTTVVVVSARHMATEFFGPLLPDIFTEIPKKFSLAPDSMLARTCVNILARGNDSFRSSLLQSEPTVELTYVIGACSWLRGDKCKDDEVCARVQSYLTLLFRFREDPAWAEPALFALSRHFDFFHQNPKLLPDFANWISACLRSPHESHRRRALKTISQIVKNEPSFLKLERRETQQFCEGIAKTLRTACLQDVSLFSDEDQFLKYAKRLVIVLDAGWRSCEPLTQFVLKIMDDAPPAAMNLISFIAGRASRDVIKNFWHPLFSALKNDPLLFEPAFLTILDCICACYKDGIDDQVREFLAVMESARTELVFIAASRLRQLSEIFESLSGLVQDRIITDQDNALVPSLFRCFSAFNPANMKPEIIVQMLCKGIIDPDRRVCESALIYLTEFRLTYQAQCKESLNVLLMSITSSMFDGLHAESIYYHFRVLRRLFEDYPEQSGELLAKLLTTYGFSDEYSKNVALRLVELRNQAIRFNTPLLDLLQAQQLITHYDYTCATSMEEEVTLLSQMPLDEVRDTVPQDVVAKMAELSLNC